MLRHRFRIWFCYDDTRFEYLHLKRISRRVSPCHRCCHGDIAFLFFFLFFFVFGKLLKRGHKSAVDGDPRSQKSFRVCDGQLADAYIRPLARAKITPQSKRRISILLRSDLHIIHIRNTSPPPSLPTCYLRRAFSRTNLRVSQRGDTIIRELKVAVYIRRVSRIFIKLFPSVSLRFAFSSSGKKERQGRAGENDTEWKAKRG